MDYELEFKPKAIANLEQLTQIVKERILQKIKWLVENFEQITPQALTGDLRGLFKLRVGDQRNFRF
ncbi:MAG: type II toxin-antitoxin system mRNA interferase toxin, RelE/StbE family [Symploca sp. SIO2E6]|nr:type II toxin-antitoxin system mRNA interferase toxin, RelE/StbE family [Symploca sp. SIO2E6]